MSQRPRFAPRQVEFVKFGGGLDQETPPLSLPPGFQRNSQNTECPINGGYRTIAGYERYDGRPRPSSALYSVLEATITGSYALGDTLTGLTSGATGVIIAVTGTGFVLTKVTGTFQAAESLQITGVTIATAVTAQTSGGAASIALEATYLNLAADEYRADITAVPGSGPILGVIQFDGVVYAFRNNAGDTACDIYKSDALGWTAVPLGRELAFTSGGTTEIVEGNTITGAISGATAVITRVVLQSGSWAAGTAAGLLIFATDTGTFQAENLNVGVSLNVATIAGDSSAITLLPDGRFEFDIFNFGGAVSSKRIYGADGVNRGFEFDGSVFVPIATGMSPDTPSYVRGHKNHLFFAFGASLQHSGIGAPYQWTLVSGAGELAMGDEITGLMVQPGDTTTAALAVFSRNKINILYGTDSDNWNLAAYGDNQGALAYTVQRLGQTLMLDDRGVVTLKASQNYGNFQDASITNNIESWINEKRPKAVSSCVVRNKNQYRLFFNDNYALFVTIPSAGLVGMTPVLFNHPVLCVWSAENQAGNEEIYFGSDDGYVFQMDRGTSFDGDAIEWLMDLTFNFSKTPWQNKQYKNAVFEVSGGGYSEFNFNYSIGYSSSDISQNAIPRSVAVNFSSAAWDSFTWDSFFWDGVTLLPSYAEMDGVGENVSITLQGSSDLSNPLTFSGVLLHFINRGMKR